MIVLFSFICLMFFIYCEYGVEKVNDICLDVYIFIGLGVLYFIDRFDIKNLDSYVVLFIFINFFFVVYC